MPQPTARIIHGDCLDVLPEIASDSSDLAICDLPYGITKNSWDCFVDLKKLWFQLQRVVCGKGPYIFTCQQPFANTLINSAADKFRYDLIWAKNRYAGHANAKRAPLRGHEIILVFGDTPIYRPQKIDSGQFARVIFAGKKPRPNQNTGVTTKTHILSRYKNPTSVLPFDRDDVRDGTGHPTQKPLNLLKWLIKTYTMPGQTVLDPTAGSFSTCIAALLSGRNSIGIEKDLQIYTNARERVLAVQRSLQPTP